MKVLEVNDSNGGVVYTLVDDDTYEWASAYKWKLSGAKGSGGYVSRSTSYTKNGKRKCVTVFLHRLVMGDPKGMEVDHINHDKLDNRRESLRVAKKHLNAHNRRIGKGEDRGVRELPNGKFFAEITVRGKRRRLGTHETKEAARRAYAKAAKRYCGEFACV